MTEVKAPSVFLTQSRHSMNVLLPSLSFSNDTSFRRPFLIALSKKDSVPPIARMQCFWIVTSTGIGVMLSQILTQGAWAGA